MISCGQAHVLALTVHSQVFSWGAGDYAALGFGNREDQLSPRLLQLNATATKVSCGRMHSLCITNKQRIFSWGTGLYGRLGHGDTEDVLSPKEILMLSNLKVIDVSAGESHSAAITQA